MSVEEITETYKILAALERAALLDISGPTAGAVQRLNTASRRRARSSDVERTIAADLEWHRALTSLSSNSVLKRMIEPLRTLVDRYERAFFGSASNDARSMEEHAIIEAMVQAGETTAAANKIEAHWLNNIEPMAAAVRLTLAHGGAQ